MRIPLALALAHALARKSNFELASIYDFGQGQGHGQGQGVYARGHELFKCMTNIYIDNILNANVYPQYPVKATGHISIHNGKQYQYIGKQNLIHTNSWWIKQIITATIVAISIIGTLGLVLLFPLARKVAHRLWRELKNHNTPIDCFLQQNVLNFCFLKHTNEQIKLGKKFSLKNYLDNLSQKDWWTSNINCDDLKSIHNLLIQGRNIPPLLGSTPLSSTLPLMTGLSLIAYYLSRKTGLRNLYVCENLFAFREELNRIKTRMQDERIVLIVPTHQNIIEQRKDADCPQHAVAVCIEKQDGKMKICVLNSQPAQINPENVHLRPGPFFGDELIFSFMQSADLPKNTQFYAQYMAFGQDLKPSEGFRQYSQESCCSTFALRDAVAFLKDKKFFKRLGLKKGLGELLDPFLINKLPANFVKTTQKWIKLKEFISNFPAEAKMPLGSSKRSFLESIARHRVDVSGHMQNRLISRRMYKYQLLLLFFMNHFSDSEINAMIDAKLLKKKISVGYNYF